MIAIDTVEAQGDAARDAKRALTRRMDGYCERVAGLVASAAAGP